MFNYSNRKLIRFRLLLSAITALATISLTGIAQSPQRNQLPIPTAPRIFAEYPIRIGGVYTSGLNEPSTAGKNLTQDSRLSPDNMVWIAGNCDVIALNKDSITPDTFRGMVKAQHLFTPLLYTSASSVYEQPGHSGDVGGWKPELSEWTLRNTQGAEVKHPDSGGHWMDFGNTEWVAHWVKRVNEQRNRYGAYGTVISELPIGNTFITEKLAKYPTTSERAQATLAGLKVARKQTNAMLIPSALGFDLVSGHRSPNPQIGITSPALSGRYWNDYYSITDGGWCEGWIHPYWDNTPVSENLWEIQMEAADRAGYVGQVFIAACAYRNDAELEYGLANYLLIVHHQGRVVFQPMPLRPNEPTDAGYSLAILKRELSTRKNFFRVPLGVGMQIRHQITVNDGPVWRRQFQFGDVYVNSSPHHTVTVGLGGKMKRLNGQYVRKVTLPPRTGAVLLYTLKK